MNKQVEDNKMKTELKGAMFRSNTLRAKISAREMIRASIIFIISIIIIGTSVGLLTNLRINSGSLQVTSDQQLTCYWTLNDTINANVTWYKNGAQNTTQSNINCIANQQCSTSGDGNIPSAYIKRGDVWVCSISYDNGTGIENQNVSVNIINSPPTPPHVFLQNGTEITNVTAEIQELNTTILIINSTDADNDSITYTLNDTTFCSINANTGSLTCNPTEISQRGRRDLKIGAQDSASAQFITFAINVTPTNHPPYFNPVLQNKTVLENAALNYTIVGADDDSAANYNFSIVSDLNSVIIQAVSNTSAIIMFNNSGIDKASFFDKGNHTINITIADSGIPPYNTSATSPKNFTASFTLDVISVNHLPNISLIVYNNNSLIQGSNLSIYINATDIDNDTLTFSTSPSLNYPINYSSTTDKTDPSGISFAYAWINISSLTNDNVANRNLTIYVFDTKENSTRNIFLNITNINDPPTIFDLSYYTTNTLGNTNISNLLAYTGVPLKYVINATDIDMLTYQGDTITYSTNDSNYPINSTTGLISFTPLASGNYSFLVNVTDNAGLKTSKIAYVEVRPNTNPIFTQNPITIQCYEYDGTNYAHNCYYNISSNVSDVDSGDYVQNFWTNSQLFTIDSATGIINFTADQSMVGNYSVLLNITDTRGGMNSTLITLTINNTNNPPTISSISTPQGRMVIGNAYDISITANDNDLSLNNTYENLTFNISMSGPDLLLFSLAKDSANQADISFSPSLSSQAGNYTLNISVKDFYNNISIQSINFFIYNITNIPNITQITPFGTPLFSTVIGGIGVINTSFANTTNFPGKVTNITIYENSSYIFNETTIVDNRTYFNTLNYTWYYDDNLISGNSSLNKTFDFFSSGNHTIQFLATDLFNYNNTFEWNIDIIDIPRAPLLVNQLDNLTVNGSFSFNNYMTYYNGQTKFIDYDDDPQNVGRTIGNQTTIIFNATSCPFATFTFTYGDLNVHTTRAGECYVNFTATATLNNSLFATSNTVLINITGVTNDTIVTPITITTTSSGGGSRIETVPVPLPEEVEKPRPLQIITPKLVTIYQNATVKVPIVLNNSWNDTLEGITLSAYTNATNVTVYIDHVYFPRIYTGQSEEATLTISNYKSEGHYEIQIVANVTNPEYRDIGTIYVNSADTRSQGDAIENKISFARDLLGSNPECQELTELLNQAKKALSENNFDTSAKLVDNVINGCKYLVSTAKQNIEKPSTPLWGRLEWNKKYTDYLTIGLFVMMFLVALYYVVKKDKPDQDF